MWSLASFRLKKYKNGCSSYFLLVMIPFLRSLCHLELYLCYRFESGDVWLELAEQNDMISQFIEQLPDKETKLAIKDRFLFVV